MPLARQHLMMVLQQSWSMTDGYTGDAKLICSLPASIVIAHKLNGTNKRTCSKGSFIPILHDVVCAYYPFSQTKIAVDWQISIPSHWPSAPMPGLEKPMLQVFGHLRGVKQSNWWISQPKLWKTFEQNQQPEKKHLFCSIRSFLPIHVTKASTIAVNQHTSSFER